MHRIAERIEDGRHVTVDRWVVVPDVGHRQYEIFGEGAGPIDADTERVLAEMAAAGQAVAAPATDDVPFAADDFAGVKIGHIGTDLDDLADELVADNH